MASLCSGDNAVPILTSLLGVFCGSEIEFLGNFATVLDPFASRDQEYLFKEKLQA